MSAIAGLNPIAWSGGRDAEGHRTYKAAWLVECEVGDGPANVLEAANLPQVGSQWSFGLDSDLWAWCTAEADLKPKTQGESCKLWEVALTFTTKPPDTKRCTDQSITDPLLIPPEISGDFVKYTEEASYDRFGLPITNSAWEQFKGPQVEWDKNRPSVKIKQNFALLNLDVFAPMVDTVNAFPMWGLPPRCIKLSKAPWSRKFYGTCYVYYEITFEFDINVNNSGFSGFDRDILDEGTKVLNGHWGSGGAGSGLTINILSVSSGGAGTLAGSILTISLGSGGSGYQANTIFVVAVSSGGGTGGSVLASTNASGVVTTVSVQQGGSGYSVTSGATTSAPVGWVIDPINGNPPNPQNPSHFIQYKDRNGENTRVVLNGAGLPSDAIISLPPQQPQSNGSSYLSIAYGNTGNPLLPNSANSPFWVLLPNGTFSSMWSGTTAYSRGDMVTASTIDNQGNITANVLFVCVAQTSTNQYPPDNTGGILTPAIWHQVNSQGDGTTTYQGNYSVATTYQDGSVVIPPATTPLTPGTTGGSGNRHVEKYDESDFSILGIPLILG